MKKKREKPFRLDLSFDEALKRVAQTDPRELKSSGAAKPKKKKTRSGRKNTIAPSVSHAKRSPKTVPRRLEPLHDPLSSSGRLMGVFGPVIEALVLPMLDPGVPTPLSQFA